MSTRTATTPEQELTRVTGTAVELHAKSGDNWSRAKIRQVNGQTVWVTAKFRIEKGETFDAECTFNPKYKSYDCVRLAAGTDGKVSNEVVILKLVDTLDGVGKIKARRLGDHFPNLFESLTTEPEKIAVACGADLNKVKLVAEQLTGERSELSRVTTLVGKGYPHHLAKRIAKNDRAYVTAISSPYAAIKLVNGLGWLLADEIGRKQGIAVDDPARIEAGIDHWYREEVTGNGHTIVEGRTLLAPESLPSLLGIGRDVIAEKIDAVLLPRGDGWYTSKRHYDNATIISGFFRLTSPQGVEEGGEEG